MSLLVMACFILIGLSSAFISGLTGLAGGVLLLSCLSLFFPISVVIPLHALIQVAANSSRVFLLKEHIEWKVWRDFNLLSIPAGIIGAYSVSYLPKSSIKIAVGIVIFLAATYTLWPRVKKQVSSLGRPDLSSREQFVEDIKVGRSWRYVSLGALSSLLGMVVGATGPLIAPFFMIAGLKRERFIATKSACQLTVQFIKTILFFKLLSFDYSVHINPIALTVSGVFLGTWLAKKVLRRITGGWLEKVIALMIIILAIRMMSDVM